MYDFNNDSLVFDKRRIAIGNEWTILYSDLEELFLDTIRSDYHESPVSEMEGPRGGTRADGSPSPSLTSVPDAFDSVFSAAMSNHDFNPVAKYYNKDISYNVYSYNECPFFDRTCDSCRSFYILNYYPLDRKPNQHFNKINFLKCIWLLEYFFPSDKLTAISFPTNLYKTTFFAGIRAFCNKDTAIEQWYFRPKESTTSVQNRIVGREAIRPRIHLGSVKIINKRPFYIRAVNCLQPENGLKLQIVDSGFDGSQAVSSFYADIYNSKKNISKNKQNKSLFPLAIFIVAAGVLIVLIIVRNYNRKRSGIEGPNNRKLDIIDYCDHFEIITSERTYYLAKGKREEAWNYLVKLLKHKNRRTGVKGWHISEPSAIKTRRTYDNSEAHEKQIGAVKKVLNDLYAEMDAAIDGGNSEEIEQVKIKIENAKAARNLVLNKWKEKEPKSEKDRQHGKALVGLTRIIEETAMNKDAKEFLEKYYKYDSKKRLFYFTY